MSTRTGAGRDPAVRRLLAAAAAVMAIVALLTAAPPNGTAVAAGGPPDASVAAWNDALERAFGPAAQTPAEGLTYVGLLHYSIYDAVVAVRGGYQPLFYRGPSYPGASAEAAVAAAGRTTLTKLLPTQAATFEALYANALQGIPDGQAKQAGIQAGEAAAKSVLALPIVAQVRPGLPYVASSTAPGVYEATAPAPAAVIGVWLSTATPVFLATSAQVRPSGSLPLASAGYAADFNEVKTLGSKTSTTRTAAQTDQALFWSEAPVQQALRSMRGFITDRQLDIVDAARFSAMVGAAYQEGMLVCADAKYAMPTWRPVTAIRRADTDDNDATTKDEAWEPLLGTPNHPEYPSAHSCVTVGAAAMVEKFLGSAPYSYTMVSVAGRPSRTFTSAAEFARDVAEARIYGGIHFRQATIDGALMGRQVADLIGNNHFKSMPGGSTPAAPLPPNTGNSTAESSGNEGLLRWSAVVLLTTAFGLTAWRRRAG